MPGGERRVCSGETVLAAEAQVAWLACCTAWIRTKADLCVVSAEKVGLERLTGHRRKKAKRFG